MPTTNELGAVFDGGQPPEWLHPAQYPYEKHGNNQALKRLSEVAGATHDRLATTHEYRVTRGEDPYTQAAKLNRIVDEIGHGFARDWQEAKDSAKREIGRVEADLTAKAGLKVNADYRSAIVGVFSGLKPSERTEAIEAALEAGDGSTLATLLEAPSLVTGLTAEQKGNIKARAFAKADAEGFALLQELNRATVKAERSSLACIEAQMKLRQGTEQFARRTERSKQLERQLRAG